MLFGVALFGSSPLSDKLLITGKQRKAQNKSEVDESSS
jgi:hypothetical protein